MPGDESLGDIGLRLRAVFGGLFDDPSKTVDEITRRGLEDAGQIVLDQAVELAPYRTGRLEDSGRLEIRGNRVEITFDVDYAAQVHELPEGAVGPGTLAKPGNELGPAGPKYLERPIIAMQDRFGEIAGEAIEKAVGEEVKQ